MCNISIIIPCCNVERYIDKCVSSLLGQSIGSDYPFREGTKQELIYTLSRSLVQ